MKDAIEAIESQFTDQSDPEDFIEAHQDSERTEAFADFFQLLVDVNDVQALNDSDAKFNVTFKLSLWERLKVLFTGRYNAMVGPLLTEAVGFGICWQHQDILRTLREAAEKTTEGGERTSG